MSGYQKKMADEFGLKQSETKLLGMKLKKVQRTLEFVQEC